MRRGNYRKQPAHQQTAPIDASVTVFAMARHGVGFAFSDAGTLRLSNTAACPSELWNLFLSSDQFAICAAVRAMVAGAKDPPACPDESA